MYQPPSSTFWIAAGVCGTLFLSYCIYFDKKRRSDPNYKNKLRNKRKQEKLKKTNPSNRLPDFMDVEAVQRFFTQEISLGEVALKTGNIYSGVDHLCTAVAICGQPQQLLLQFQQSLPEHIFRLLLERLPIVGQRLAALGE